MKENTKLEWYGKNVQNAIDGTLRQKLDILGEALVDKIRTVLSQKGTGITYKIGNKIHVASAPGQPPVIMSGDLHGSIGHEIRDAISITNLILGSWSDHAVAMEFGQNATAARPWLGVTLEANKEFIQNFLSTGWF